ncbi:MAG: foldase protein PrsA [Myxococcota bacterium]
MCVIVSLIAATSSGCDGCDGCRGSEPEQPEPQGETASAEAEPAPPEQDPTEEACARVVLVAWEGAEGADSEIERSKQEARDRIEEAHRALEEGEMSLGRLAYRYSDLRSGQFRSGVVGTYPYERWPSRLEYVRDVVYELDPGEVSDIIETDHGFALVGRCASRQIDVRFVLIRHEDAKGATKDLRSKEAARKKAEQLREQVAEGADIAEIAREHSEEPGSADKGGYLQDVGNGALDPAFEDAAVALDVGELSEVVDGEFGFMFIRRITGDEPGDSDAEESERQP